MAPPSEDPRDEGDELPALRRRVVAPLLALVTVLVGLAAGDSIHGLWQMRRLSDELGRMAWTDLALQSSLRAVVRTQLERHAALDAALDAREPGAGGDGGGRDTGDVAGRDERLAAVARFGELGARLDVELRAARERLLESGFGREELDRTLRPLAAFEVAARELDAHAARLLSRSAAACDAECRAAVSGLERDAGALDLRASEILDAVALTLDRSAARARAGEEAFLRRSLLVSTAAIVLGLSVSVLLVRRILGILRRGVDRRAETLAALRRAERRSRAVLDASLDPIVTVGADGTIRSASRAFARTFGWDPAELVGQNVRVLMPEPHRSQHDAHLARHLETGERTVLGRLREVEAARRDGSTFPCELWIDAVQRPPGEEPLFCGVLRDITERKRGEKRLQQYASHLEVANLELSDASKALQDAVDELRRSNEDLDEFAHAVSHDLKEPLRGLQHTVRFLLEDQRERLDPEGVRRLERLGDLAGRLTAMIEALLEFSRLGRAELALSRTDLGRVVDGVLESLDLALRERKVEVRVPQPLPVAICSEPLVAEVFRNLIENASRYNERPDPWIEIGFVDEGSGGAPRFYVRDNGVGIAPRHQELVFRLFERVGDRERFGPGTGLGLTLVRKIVERHGGRVWVESIPGSGSTFWFTLARERS